MFKKILSVINFLIGSTNVVSGPLKVHWDLEYTCNSRCKNCNRWTITSHADQLSHQDSISLIQELAQLGVKNISFAGNEPTLRKDLPELIALAKKEKMVTSLNTNAILLNKDYINGLVDAGLDMIYFSIDGYNDDTQKKIRGVSNNVTQILKAKDEFKKFKKRPQLMVNTVVNHINVNYLDRIVEFVFKEKFDGMIIQPSHNIPIYFEQDKASIMKEDDIKILTNKMKEIWTKYKRFLTLPWSYYKNFERFYREPEKLKIIPCTAGFLTLDIRPNGELVPCPVGFRSGGIYKPGNLKELWYGKKMNNIRKSIRAGDHPQCWFACIIPINIVLDNIKHPDLRLFNLSLIKHIFKKIGL